MKYILLLFFIFSFTSNSQILFSEYAEGTSYNKYLEIYNYSEEVVNLSNYGFPSCSNGCDVDGEWDYMNYFPEGAVINPGDVYVIAHPNAIDPNSQYYTAEIGMYSDYEFTYLSNGNDVFALVNIDTQQILDVIGAVGPDPGDGWDVAGVLNGTKDHTLVRKSNINSGNNGDWVNSAGTNTNDSEWIVLENEVWDNLGFHECDSCGITVIYGCTDLTANNYNPKATIDDGSCEYSLVEGCSDSTACNYDPLASNGFFTYSNTDTNMTIALEFSVGNSAGLEYGDVVGVFYNNSIGELVCGGAAQWENQSLAIAAWGTEAGLDNGFNIGESFIFIIQKSNGQMFLTNSFMNNAPPFSASYTANGFGQITELVITDLLLDEVNCEYSEEYYDCEGNCINDADGDGICDEFDEAVFIFENSFSSKRIKTIDLMGRELESSKDYYQIFFKVFEDGTVKKLIKLK